MITVAELRERLEGFDEDIPVFLEERPGWDIVLVPIKADDDDSRAVEEPMEDEGGPWPGSLGEDEAVMIQAIRPKVPE